MAMELNCPECGQSVRVAVSLIGKKLRCKKCQGVFIAEDPNSPFEEVRDFEIVDDEPESRPVRGPKPRQRREYDDDEPESGPVRGPKPRRGVVHRGVNEERRTRGGPRMRRSELRTIAFYQRALLLCIAGHIMLYMFQAISPHILILIALAIVGITGSVFVFLLSTELYGAVGGVILAILALIPIIGLIAIAVANSKATAILNKHGCDVGFLGARLSQFD